MEIATNISNRCGKKTKMKNTIQHTIESLALACLVILFNTIPAAAQTAAGQTVNVKSYGAVGDGVHNDSASFQQAIVYAASHQETLFVPKGTYVISNLAALSHLHMQGEDSSSILLLVSKSLANKTQCLILNKNTSDVDIENISFNANGLNNSSKSAFCVWTNLTPGQIDGIRFNQCFFTGSKGYGAMFLIGTAGSITNVSITNCSFNNTGASSMQLRGVAGMTFSGNSLSNWAQLDKDNAAVSLQSQENTGLVFTNNTFTNGNAGHFAIECAGAYTRNSQFIGNTFNANGLGAAGISGYFSNCLFKSNRHLSGGGDHRSGYELVGDNDTVCNTYVDNGTITISTTPPFGNEKGGNGYLITDDTVIGRNKNGMCLGIGGADTVKNAVIENNIFDNRNASGSAPAIAIGARGLVSGLIIRGNTLYGAGLSSCIRFNVTSPGTPFPAGYTYVCENVTIEKNNFIGQKGVRFDKPGNWKGIEFKDNDFSQISTKVFDQDTQPLTSDIKVRRNRMPASQQ